MSAVKQSNALRHGKCVLFAAFGLIVLNGCANSQLARFAPPGIVKYEDIASEKPQSEEIKARIEERRAEPNTGKFPVLSETPGVEQRPQSRPPAVVEAQINALDQTAKEIKEEIETQRQLAAEETALNLGEEANQLRERIDRDSAAAARERREQLTAPEDDEK